MTNSFPTPLSPWYVLMSYDHNLGEFNYYTSREVEDKFPWTDTKDKAMLFLNIHTAITALKSIDTTRRIDLVTLWNHAQVKEYGRD